jgi:hypothetical protein
MSTNTAAGAPATDQQITDLAYQIHTKAHAQSIGTTVTPLGLSDAFFLARQELGVAQPKVTGPENETADKTSARVAKIVQSLDLALQKQQTQAAPDVAAQAADALHEPA